MEGGIIPIVKPEVSQLLSELSKLLSEAQQITDKLKANGIDID